MRKLVQDVGGLVVSSVHFSSMRLDWRTPHALYAELNKEFHFDLDPCGDQSHPLAPHTFTTIGLDRPWFGNVFMNPPYGREIGKWLEKATKEVKAGNANVVVCLIPSRTDTRWWHDYVMKGEIRFIKGRLHFDDHKNAAPFPSAVVVFRGV